MGRWVQSYGKMPGTVGSHPVLRNRHVHRGIRNCFFGMGILHNAGNGNYLRR